MQSENSQPGKRDEAGNSRLLGRFSLVLIGDGEDVQSFPSVDSVPQTLRRKLQQTTQGANSATILIADKRGRQELVRALEQHPQLNTPVHPAPRTTPPPFRQPFSWKTWAELLLPIALGASLWLYFSSRF